MSYRIRIFQIQENAGGTDIEIVVGSEREYDPSVDPDVDEILPTAVGSIERSIEFDRGVYEHGSANITVRDLDADYFNTYVDLLNQPFVVVVQDTATDDVIFHGLIDRESIQYNPGTSLTHFTAFSWEYILDSVNTAGRTVYETQLFQDFDASTGGNPELYIPRFVGGDDLDTIVGLGDVLVLDTPSGEHRGVILTKFTNANDLLLVINGQPEEELLATETVPSGNVDLVPINFTTFTSPGVGFTVADRDLWAVLAKGETDSVIGTITPTSSDPFTVRFNNPNFGSNKGTAWWQLTDDQETVGFFFAINTESIYTDLDDNGFDFKVDQNTGAKAGATVRILGNAIYGYTAPDPNSNYPTDEIVEALFTLTNVGVLQHIADTFTFPSDFACEEDKWIEYPANLLEALRQIQNTCYSFLNLVPSVDAGGLPRIEVEVTPRTKANTTDGTVLAATDVRSFVENTSDFTPAAVVVTPSTEYFKPKSEDNSIDTVGFYYDGIDTVTPELSGRPSGPDVVEITVNKTAAYEGDLFTGEGIAVRNDTVLKQIARRYYEFYQNLNQPCSLELDSIRTDLLGNFVTISEGDLSRTIYVEKTSFDLATEVTSIEGRIGEYVDVVTADPVAVIEGVLTYIDTDAGGDEDVSLSGLSSYDPLGASLTYSWQVNPPSAPISGPILETTLAVGSHTVQLTVTKPAPGSETDVTSVTVEVLDDEVIDDDGDDNIANFTIFHLSVDGAGDVYGSFAGDAATKVTGGIEIETSPDDVVYTPLGGSPYNNPQTDLLLHSTLADGDTLWVRVTLKNLDGTDGEEQTGQITNGTSTGVTSGANITDHALVRGDGGALGIQDTGIIVDDSDNLTFPNNTFFYLDDLAGGANDCYFYRTTGGDLFFVNTGENINFNALGVGQFNMTGGTSYIELSTAAGVRLMGGDVYIGETLFVDDVATFGEDVHLEAAGSGVDTSLIFDDENSVQVGEIQWNRTSDRMEFYDNATLFMHATGNTVVFPGNVTVEGSSFTVDNAAQFNDEVNITGGGDLTLTGGSFILTGGDFDMTTGDFNLTTGDFTIVGGNIIGERINLTGVADNRLIQIEHSTATPTEIGFGIQNTNDSNDIIGFYLTSNANNDGDLKLARRYSTDGSPVDIITVEVPTTAADIQITSHYHHEFEGFVDMESRVRWLSADEHDMGNNAYRDLIPKKHSHWALISDATNSASDTYPEDKDADSSDIDMWYLYDYGISGGTQEVVMELGPHGYEVPCLHTITDSPPPFTQGGGYHTPAVYVDPNKSYMIGGYVKPMNFLTSHNAGVYFGPEDTDVDSTLESNWDGSSVSNPYFEGAYDEFPAADVWYLFIACIHHQGHSDSASHWKAPFSGIYRCDTGEKISDINNDFRMNPTQTQFRLRFFELNTDLEDAVERYWYKPFVIEMDGTEPSVMDLVGKGYRNVRRNEQTSDPTAADDNDDDKDHRHGDIWINTSTNTAFIMTHESASSLAQWVEVIDLADDLTFEGEITFEDTVNVEGTTSLRVKAGPTDDAVRISFYPDSAAQSTRWAYIGFPTAGDFGFHIRQEHTTADFTLQTQGTGVIKLRPNATTSFQASDTLVYSLVDHRIDGDIDHNGSEIGLFNGPKVTQASAIGKLTDSTGGTANATVAAVSGSGDDATINDNFADLTAKINALIDVLGTSSGISITAD